MRGNAMKDKMYDTWVQFSPNTICKFITATIIPRKVEQPTQAHIPKAPLYGRPLTISECIGYTISSITRKFPTKKEKWKIPRLQKTPRLPTLKKEGKKDER
jgi:hypothetical protein